MSGSLVNRKMVVAYMCIRNGKIIISTDLMENLLFTMHFVSCITLCFWSVPLDHTSISTLSRAEPSRKMNSIVEEYQMRFPLMHNIYLNRHTDDAHNHINTKQQKKRVTRSAWEMNGSGEGETGGIIIRMHTIRLVCVENLSSM